MSHSLPFVSAYFYLQRVTSLTPAVVRVRFTHDPKRIDPSLATDALNPANYTITGSHLAIVTAVGIVADDPQAVDVYVNVPLAAGSWTMAVSPTVQMEDGTTLQSPTSLLFGVSALRAIEPANGGAQSDDAARVIRKHLPMSFVGRAWTALIEALAVGDQYNWDNTVAAFDQMFLSSASGAYLDRRANDRGISRPKNVGMPDALFSRLATKISAKKLTSQVFLEILEVFYGTDAVRAYVESATEQPYRLEDGHTLRLVVDGKDELEVVFTEGDFAQIGQASAAEVAAAINRQARAAGFGMFGLAAATVDGTRLRIYSGSMGLASNVLVDGGLAQNGLQLPTPLPVTFSGGTVFNVTTPDSGIFRYTTQSADGTLYLDVVEGDVVNIVSPIFTETNRGSYKIVAVSTSWNGSTFDHSFDIKNEEGVAEAGIAILEAEDVQFFRPTRTTIHRGEGRTVIVAEVEGGDMDIVLPATTQAVGREEFTAAYVQASPSLAVSSVVLGADGLARATTEVAHLLGAGDRVVLEGLFPGTAVPAILAGVDSTPGNPGTSAACQTTLWDGIRVPDGLVGGRILAEMAQLPNGDVLMVGGTDGASPQVHSRLFRITGSSTLTSGVAVGRDQYTYEWATAASSPVAVVGHTLTALSGSLAGKALLLGGAPAGTGTSTQQLYDASGNAWSAVPNGTLTARYNHTATLVTDAATDDDVVFIVGGQLDATTSVPGIQTFKPIAGGTIAAHASETEGRLRHRAVAISDYAFLAVGGARIVAGVLHPRNDCYGYDTDAAAAVAAGYMAIARMDHGLVKLRDGVVLALGGYGRNLSNETSNRVLAEAEIWDRASGRWRPAGRMKYARRHPIALLLNGLVYVVGGLDASDDPILTTEIYNPATGRWSVAPSTAADSVGSYGTGIAFDDVGLVIGSWNGTTVAAAASLLIPGSNTVGAKGLNDEVTVSAILSSTSFAFEMPENQYASTVDGTCLPVAAPVGVHAGPFVWNRDEDPAVTAIEGDLQTALVSGKQYLSLTLGAEQALEFPDEPGYLALGFGTKDAVYPVRYLGRLSDDTLRLDFAFVMPSAVPAGAKVTLLSQKGPYVPASPENAGSFYVTASSSGRIAAQQAIEDNRAAGFDATFTISYPGDKGLGHAGHPTTGQYISEKVMVWGGDDLDEEVAEARGED